MRFEKWLLIAALVFMLAMAAALITRTALRGTPYEVEKMVVGRDRMVGMVSSAVPYRLKTRRNPFVEKTETGVIDVKMDLPDAPVLEMAPPPVFWNRQGL